MGQSARVDARCATHTDQPSLGRCMTCGKITCFECGSLVDQRILCFNCATIAATTTATTETKSTKAKRGLFAKKK